MRIDMCLSIGWFVVVILEMSIVKSCFIISVALIVI